jgi:catechol 2,3-dioxygenase-like lactoylglutathione lyase family enzyme
MKRLHVHVAVDDLSQAVKFYSTLFAAQPTVTKPDYAKWMLDDPRVNFAISMRGAQPGINHLGIQVDSQDELHEVYDRLRAAEGPMVVEQGQTQCCYHRSEKAWIDDPAGISWEAFFTTGESTVYGDDTGERSGQARHAEKSNVLAAAESSVRQSACCGGSAGQRC